MSFLVKTPKLPQAATQEGSQVSTYREAEAVPNGFGRDRFVSHWLCQPYDRKTRPMGSNQPAMEIASIAAGYREGPIDFVGKIWRDGKLVDNLDFTFSEHGNPESQQFAVPALGQNAKAIVHRGTADAPLSIVANLNAKTGQNHPPYRRHAWIEWVDLDLGQGTTALPDLHVEFGKFTPAIGTFGVSSFGQWGVNTFAAVYALLTSDTVFGIDAAAYFDPADWAAQCVALETTGVSRRKGPLTYCHPVFKAAQSADALLSAVLANVDGYLFVDGGKFRIGWFPSQAPGGGLPEITEDDLEAAPQGDAPDWNRGPSSVTVVYRDFDRHYGDVPALCPAPANIESGMTSTPVRVDRPMIHTDWSDEDILPQASLIAAEIAAARASAESPTTLTVKKSRAVKGDGSPLMPGDLFSWDYGPHSLDLVVRVVARRMRSGQTSDLLEIIPERGQFPLPYVAPIDPRVLPTNAAPGVIDVADVRLWLLPSGFGSLRQIAPLVNRAHRGIYRVDLHLSPTGAAPWEDILDSRFFAAKVAVTNGGIGSGAATIRVTSTSVDFTRMAAQSSVNQTDDKLLLLVDNEVMSVSTITTGAANTYDLGILRARKGTTAAAHANAATGFLFYRDEIMAAEHAEFYRVRDGSNTYDAATATKRFKLQLFTLDEAGLAKPDDPGISLQLPDLSADETAGYTIVLTNEAHTVACANDGTVNAGQLGAGSTAKTIVKVLRGGTALTPVMAAPNSDQFSASIAVQTNATGTKEDADTFRADTLTADTGTLEIDILVAGAFTIRKVFSLTKSRAGAIGATGGTGGTGATGNTVKRIYIRSTINPGTPSGNSPIGWSFSVPSGSDALWQSDGTFDPGGNLVGSWSAPQRVSGNIVLYQTPASTSGYALLEGDLLFDPTDGFHPYRWENPGAGYQWVSKPYGDAAIANLAAGKITAGTIQAAISIGTTGFLSAGTGFSQFYVDTNQFKYGGFLMKALAGVNGNYWNMGKFDAFGNFQTGPFANGWDNQGNLGLLYNGNATVVGLASTGEWTAQLLRADSNSDPRSTSAPLYSAGGAWIGGSLDQRGKGYFNDETEFNAKMKLLSTRRFEFSRAGPDLAYFDEDWGGNYHGDGTHPFRIRGAALCLDGCSVSGNNYTAGRIYLTDTVYLYVSDGALWLNDANGNRALT